MRVDPVGTMHVNHYSLPSPKPPPSQSLLDRLRLKWWRLWHRHRDAGSRPIVDIILDGFTSDRFGQLLKWGAVGSLLILLAGRAIGMDWPTRLSLSGLTLDVCGVLFVFKEWLLQHNENAARELEAVHEVYSKLAGEPSKTVEPLGPDEPHVVHVGKHLMDGARDRINEHVALALPGIGLLVLGFAFQMLAVLLNFWCTTRTC